MFPHSILGGRVWAAPLVGDCIEADKRGGCDDVAIGIGASDVCSIRWLSSRAAALATGLGVTFAVPVNCGCGSCLWVASMISWNSVIAGIPFAVVGDHCVAAANRGTGRRICCHWFCIRNECDSCGAVCRSSNEFLRFKQKCRICMIFIDFYVEIFNGVGLGVVCHINFVGKRGEPRP